MSFSILIQQLAFDVGVDVVDVCRLTGSDLQHTQTGSKMYKE